VPHRQAPDLSLDAFGDEVRLGEDLFAGGKDVTPSTISRSHRVQG
jgi:hypothetical protein